MSIAYLSLGDAAWVSGNVQQAADYYRQAIDAVGHASHAGAWFVLNALYPQGTLALRQADAGDADAAQKTLSGGISAVAKLRASEPAASQVPAFAECFVKFAQAGLALAHDDARMARQVARESASSVRDLTPNGPCQGFVKEQCTYNAVDEQGQAEYRLGEYAAAEQTLRAALDAHKGYPDVTTQDHRDVAATKTLLALSVARQGRAAEAEQLIDPVVTMHRALAARNHGDRLQSVELAAALYAKALCESDKRAALLREAASLLDSLPPEMKALHSARLWRDRIREATR